MGFEADLGNTTNNEPYRTLPKEQADFIARQAQTEPPPLIPNLP